MNFDHTLFQKYFPEAAKHGLRPFQQKAFDHILKGENYLCVVPTGMGKSLIFQLAALHAPGMTIVVSPLVALMNEQVEQLKERGIKAVRINGEMGFREQRKLLRELGKNPPKLLYVSPERLRNTFFRASLIASGIPVSFVAIDEAHSISQWGIDFRPEYSCIPPFLSYLNERGEAPTVIALTATLGEKARNDITDSFHISHCDIHKQVVRKELKLHFLEVDKEPEKNAHLLRLIGQKDTQYKKALVYFYSKSKTKRFAERIKLLGIPTGYYHADCSSSHKSETYQKFKDGRLKVLCATSAFGMGMDIRDIDLVIHYHLPNSVEEYYQMVGRAARDPSLVKQAHCHLLWSETNFEHKLMKEIPERSLSRENLEQAFCKLHLKNKAGKVTTIDRQDYYAQGLVRCAILFERFEVITSLGEVNGTPKTITFHQLHDKWKEILQKMRKRDSWVKAAEVSSRSLQEMVDFVWQQELSGNIDGMDPYVKKLFFTSPFDELPEEAIEKMLAESNKVEHFQMQAIRNLKELVESGDQYNHYLENLLGDNS